ncbi:MAG: hypothetical protein D6689_04685 [Deltaproteobacteria bacterium]|nr:MAG: hypothetical protein D6689_04685 [Deltaproteobacteria bacterium]
MVGRAPVALAAVAAMVPAGVRAQTPPEGVAVSLRIDACVDVDAAEVRRLFALELGASVPSAVERDDPDAIAVTAHCDGPLVQVGVRDPVTGKSLARRIRLGAKGRERLLALAMMELLVASWIELQAPPKVAPADARAPEATRRSARAIATRRLPAAPPRWRATAAAVGGAVAGRDGWRLGGGVRVAFDGPASIGWGADVLVESGTRREPLGAVDVTALWGGAWVYVHRSWRSFRARAGVGGRVGSVTLSGRPAGPGVAGGTVSGKLAAPIARATVGILGAGRIAIELSAETGYHVYPVRGRVDGSDGVNVEGGWVAAYLGVGWSW